MDPKLLEVITDHACELSIMFIVLCVGIAIIVQSFRKHNGNGSDTGE